MEGGVSLAVDIGGTFTDVVLQRGEEVVVDKTLTTHHDLLEGFFRGMHAVMQRSGVRAEAVTGVLVHATTIVTNALIERRGARTAMIFTHGFRDILRIRDERRYDVYDPQIEFPRPFVAPEDVFTVKERVLADGTVEQVPDDSEIAKLASDLQARGIQSVGVCFLHSYRNASNERHVGERLKTLLPNLYISLSSDVAPQIREYLRASTTSANAYAVPITHPYLTALGERLEDEKFPTRPLIMLSSGGVVGPQTAGRLPVRMLESGPAAGALGAAYIAHALDTPDLIAFDMGGTTAKICLIQRGEPLVTGTFEVDRRYRLKEGSGLPVAVPCIDLIEIGAGGGSIAAVGDMGLLKVGPRSAGSNPGPACYGLGGFDATVTDADVVLGLLDPTNFLGGDMKLDGDAARKAVAALAAMLSISATEVARGIYQIVCEAMAGAVRAHATERGVDYRGLPMVAFGGAGPVHACGVANLINSKTVVFPPLASVLSAFGSLVTPVRLDLVRSGLMLERDLNWEDIDRLLSEMEAEGRAALSEAGSAEDAVRFSYGADMRYLGQQYELLVWFDRPTSTENARKALRKAFEDAYRIRYSIVQDDVPIEIVTWRVAAIGATGGGSPNLAHAYSDVGAKPPRRVDLWQEGQMVPVLPRAAIGTAGNERLTGPLIIEERETTLVIPPEWEVSLGPLGCIIATRIEEERR